MEKKVQIEISDLVAQCLQRMVYEEIQNQKWWKSEDEAVSVKNPIRDTIIEEMEELREQLKEKGFPKYIRYN